MEESNTKKEEHTQEFSLDSILRDDKEAFFEVEGIEYSIEESTVDEEIKYLNLYTDEKGKSVPVLSSIFELTKLKKVPFTKEHINKVIKVDKDWLELDLAQRMEFLKQLKSEYLTKLIKISRNATNKSVVEEQVKNC